MNRCEEFKSETEGLIREVDESSFKESIEELRNKLTSLMFDYIESNKIYSEGDILKISFNKYHRYYEYTCKIVNIYLRPQSNMNSNMNWPSSDIIYFARYCWKDDDGKLIIGGHCPFCEENICGHFGIDYDTLKIEVIKEKDVM
jgi:hypothetical protein